MKRYLKIGFISLVLMTVFCLSARAEEHVHRYTELYTVKPTCMEEGFTYYFCECGESYASDITKAYGHSFSEDYIVIKEPQCTENGTKARYCIRCFASGYEEDIEKLSHNWKNTDIKSTTEKDGEKRISCIQCGQIYKSEPISAISDVSLSKNVFSYNNKNQRPSVSVSDREGNRLEINKDYRLIYASKSKNPGEYTVTVAFMGAYEGEKKLKYSILPVKVKKLTAEPSTRTVYLSWKRVKGADGYALYLYKKKSKKYILIKETDNLYYTVSRAGNKRIDYGTDYCFAIKAFVNTDSGKIYSPTYRTVSVSTKPSKAYLKSCKYSSEGINVRWKKQNCDGYELFYAKNKSFSSEKRIIVKSAKSVSKNIKDISSGKTYFIKIRAYKIIGSEKHYGYFSNVLTVRT